MTALELWRKIAAQFLATPMPGVPAEYVRSFLTRFEAVFIAALQKRFDALSAQRSGRASDMVANAGEDANLDALQAELIARGFVAEAPKHGATAVWSIKTRKQGIDLEMDAVLWGDDLQLARRQAGGSSEEHAVSGLEGLKETLDLWGITREMPVSPRAPEAPAPEVERTLSATDSSPIEPIVPSMPHFISLSGLRPAPQEAQRPTSAPEAPTPLASAFDTATSDPLPEPTHDGGLRGARLEPATLVKGDRVVTAKGEHGRIENVDAWSVAGRSRSTEYRFQVRLDSGRLEPYQSVLFREVRPPVRTLPDISFDGTNFLSPVEAWKSLKSDYRQIGYYLDKASRARRPDAIREHERGAAESQARLLRHFATFYTWREQHPDVEIEGFISHLYRILELMSGAAPRFRRELDTLKRLPQDQEWGDELVAGDGVIWNQAGSGEQVYGRILSIEGRQANVAPRCGGAPIRLPLYALLLDGRTPLQVPTYSEPIYLVTLASSMLSPQDRFPRRGAVAAAVKRFLAHHTIDVPQVPDGAGMSVIDLRAPDGEAWTSDQIAFMEQALELTVYRNREASFEPWRTRAEEWSLYQDSPGKGPGIRIAPEHIPTFAHFLASALKDAGHTLNRLGTAWLIRGVQPAHEADAEASQTENGESPAPLGRESTVEGCRELEFHLPGYGQIRVVCGAHGRRDVWHNCWVGRTRYGYNGSRWSKGMVPPQAVLNAVAERGITIFGGRRVLENAESIRYL